MTTLFFLLEEPSAESMFKGLLPKILPSGLSVILLEVDYLNLLAFQGEALRFFGKSTLLGRPFRAIIIGGRFTQGVALGYNVSPFQGLSVAPRGRHMVAQGNALG